VDIETSGLSSARSKIIEISAIRVENGEVVNEYSSLINPGTSLNPYISQLTGISDDDLVNAPFFDEIAYDLDKVLKDAIFIAHNVRFDYSFVKNELEACGYSYTPKMICTVKLSRALYPNFKGHSLEKIIERHSIKVNNRHRALDDAKAIKVFSEIAYNEHGDEIFFQAINNQLKHRSLPPNLKSNALNGIKNTNGVYIIEDEKGLPTYIGKSVQIRNRLNSHFNQALVNSKEMKISQSAHNIKVIETNTELEALLLESKMIKENLPIYNRKLRRKIDYQLLFKVTNSDGYTTLNIEPLNESNIKQLNNIYGIYDTKTKAKKALLDKVKTFGLCPKLLGIEKSKTTCFNYQLRKCRGACIAEESTDIYNLRVEIALQKSKIESWPFKSPIVIDCGNGNGLVVDKWIIVGTMSEHNDSYPEFKTLESTFDLDSYRILRTYVSKYINRVNIKPLSMYKVLLKEA
jgi:DNA polymerase-3 subunit epsilon